MQHVRRRVPLLIPCRSTSLHRLAVSISVMTHRCCPLPSPLFPLLPAASYCRPRRRRDRSAFGEDTYLSCIIPDTACRLSSLVVSRPCRCHLRHSPLLLSLTLSSPPSAARCVLSPRSSPSRSKSILGGDHSSSYFLVLLVDRYHLVAS